MKFRHFSTEKGMTLIELLAALSLFATLIVLSSTVIIQLVNSEEMTSDDIALKQDTNVLISELRNKFYNGKDELCTTEDTKAKFTEVSNGIINDEGCIGNIDTKKPLSFKLTAINHSRENLSIKTTWASPQQYVLNMRKEFEIPDDMNEECIYHGDTIFPNNILKNKKCNDTLYVTGNAVFRNIEIKQGITLYVKGDMTIENGITIKNSTFIESWGDADFKGIISFHQKSKIIVKNDADFYGEFKQLGNDGSICVQGEKKFHNNLTETDFDHIFDCN